MDNDNIAGREIEHDNLSNKIESLLPYKKFVFTKKGR